MRLTVETSSEPIDLLELAARVYQGLSEEEIDEIEKIVLNLIYRSNFWVEKLSNGCGTGCGDEG